jgi:valyl-tRNA synthetase
MIMMGLEFTGTAPFETVYLHGLIRDESGRKMSKTAGNVVDPLPVMDELGTDALRFTLLVGSTPGKDMNLSLEKVEANRNFANKLWNAGRFILGAIRDVPPEAEARPNYTTADAWIWARTKELRATVDSLFRNHLYGEAGRQIYEFFWSEFADWYLEIAKLQLREGGDRAFYTADVLVSVLDTSLRLLHPFTPFVTEELWGHLKEAATAVSSKLGLEDVQGSGWASALIVAPWPGPQPQEGWEDRAIADFRTIQEIVRAIRNQRAEKKLKPSARIGATIAAGEDALTQLGTDLPVICALAGLNSEEVNLTGPLSEKPAGHIALVAGGAEIYLPLAGLAEADAERARLEKSLAETNGQIERLETLLSGPFAEKAPPHIVEAERAKLEAFRATAAKLKTQLIQGG